MKKLIYPIIIIGFLINITCKGTDLDLIAKHIKETTKEHVAYDLKTEDSTRMDVLKIIPAEDYSSSNSHFFGTSHYSDGDFWQLTLAETTDGIDKGWDIVTTFTNRGTMGYLHHDSASGYYILVYENMTNVVGEGNCIHFRFFSNITNLKANKEDYSTFLTKKIHLAASNDSYGVDPSSNVKNMGTPDITYATYKDGIWIIYYKLHFTTLTAPEDDIPGYGILIFNPKKEYEDKISFYTWEGYFDSGYSSGSFTPTTTYHFNCQTFFDNNANNAIQIARNLQGGKIGQRDKITWNGKDYYLYEAQLTSSFDWADWRLYLYSPDEMRAVPVDLNLPEITSIANPHTYQIGDTLILSAYFPTYTEGEVTKPESGAGTFVCTIDMSGLR
ncbi:hypothetical protein GF385_03520 [Candidatus Dependentiae bacterium]|nr:hypothetical protein [Candidatus Dependentiae bacterium]